ncbi:MAG: hypothetical protein KTR28_05330 [Micavibrio sp.]|nr:hypothetical protein [Micavibrio sp.]
MGTKNKDGIEYYVEILRRTVNQAKQMNLTNTAIALEVLYKDAVKWKKEHESGMLALLDTTVEISCLFFYAEEILEKGEKNCNPQNVSEFLTA